MAHQRTLTAIEHRLAESATREADWKNWGPYVAERAWGTVREDYSAGGDAWAYFPHDHARSRVYRWNEDGLAGVCNRFQNVCLAVALWNERDPIIKERLFGLSGPEGNHGEDVKEYYFYVDNTPDHSYMKYVYRYPLQAFPYAELLSLNHQRGRFDREQELIDVLPALLDQFFDITIEYAKVDQDDLLCRISATLVGTQPHPLHVLPHIWFRNTWAWGYSAERPRLSAADATTIRVEHRHLGERWWYADGAPALLFTDNDTNTERLFGIANASPYVKDGINNTVITGDMRYVNPARTGTKAAAHYRVMMQPGKTVTFLLRFSDTPQTAPFAEADAVFDLRRREADAFYQSIHAPGLADDEKRIQRQSFAGLLWSKQFYHYSIDLWLDGDPGQPAPPQNRRRGRNSQWQHLYSLDVLSMPDKWEYPWFAAWDLAFHMIPVAMIDPEWAKRQMILLLREWYMHPNGQLPAYEWAFGDANPPVHAWAALEVFRIDAERTGKADYRFLKRVFHKLLLNFTWWVNQKDRDGNNVFQGGFLGLDNIGVFDRSSPLPTGGHLEQADGTAWMALYCASMLHMALEIATHDESYEDVATKFFEHYIYIANAFYAMGDDDAGLWDEADGFFYDALHAPDGRHYPLRIRSFVGLIPLLAVEVIPDRILDKVPRFKQRMAWFIKYRPHLIQRLYEESDRDHAHRVLLSVVNASKLTRMLRYVVDPHEFLSPFGLRSLSRYHADNPFTVEVNGSTHRVGYEPAESTSGLFGGNSNWRGPIWFPINYLIIEALRKYHTYYRDRVTVALNGQMITLDRLADDLSRRLIALFVQDEAGRRPVFGATPFQGHAQWTDLIPFYEYFHGDTGEGLGASHQTGWTALVARLLHEQNR